MPQVARRAEMGQRSCRRGILVPPKQRLCCAVFLAWLCTLFGQVQATLLGITPAGGRSHSPGREEQAPRTPARLSSTFLAGGSGEAPRPLPTVLLLTVPGQRCALVPAQERGQGHRQGKVRDRQPHNGRCRCGLQPLARPSSELHRWALGT